MNRGNRRGDFSPMRDTNEFQPGNRAPRNFNNRPEFVNDAEAAEEKLIILDPDIAEVFRNSDQVNKALRQLLTLARQVAGNRGGGGGGGGAARQGARGNRRRRRGGTNPNSPNGPANPNNPNRPQKAPRMEGLPVDDEFEEE